MEITLMLNNKLNASLIALIAVASAPFAATAGEVFVDNYDYTDFSDTTVELTTTTDTVKVEDYNRAFGASASKVYYDGDIVQEYDSYSYGYSYGELTGLQMGGGFYGTGAIGAAGSVAVNGGFSGSGSFGGAGSFAGDGIVYDGADDDRLVYNGSPYGASVDGNDNIIDGQYVAGENYFGQNGVWNGQRDYARDYQTLDGSLGLSGTQNLSGSLGASGTVRLSGSQNLGGSQYLNQVGSADINLRTVSFGNSTATTSYDDYTVHTADAWELGTESINTITITETDGTITTVSGKDGNGHRTSAGTK